MARVAIFIVGEGGQEKRGRGNEDEERVRLCDVRREKCKGLLANAIMDLRDVTNRLHARQDHSTTYESSSETQSGVKIALAFARSQGSMT